MQKFSPVKNARFFHFDDNDVSLHDDVNRLLGMGKTRQFLARDRFGYFNQFSKVNWSNINDDIPKSTSLCFDEICRMKAQELLSTGEYINVLSSGGCDSVGAVCALLEADMGHGQVRVIYNDESVEEFPEFFALFKNNKNFINAGRRLVNTSLAIKGITVTGEAGDTLYGHQGCNVRFPELATLDIYDGIRILSKQFNIKNNPDELSYHIIQYGKLLGLDVKLLKEAYHVMSFGHRFRACIDHVDIDVKILNPSRIGTSFYDHVLFSDWAVTNFAKMNDLDQRIPCNYKKPMKDFIFNYTKLKEIYDVVKIGSWNYNKYCPLLERTLVVKTDDDIVIFNKPQSIVERNKEAVPKYNQTFSNFIRTEYFMK